MTPPNKVCSAKSSPDNNAIEKKHHHHHHLCHHHHHPQCMIENANCLDRAINVHGALEWRKPYFRAAMKQLEEKVRHVVG